MANNFGREGTITPIITTNAATRRGDLASLFDGPFNLSGWTPNAVEVPIPGNVYGSPERNYIGAVPGGNKGLYIQFDFGQPVSFGVWRYMASSGSDFGMWKWQVSQGGVEWRDFNPSDPEGRIYYMEMNLLSDSSGLSGWDSEWGIVPYRFGQTKYPVGSPWFADEDGAVNSLFFRYWRLVGVSEGANGGRYVSPFRPLDGEAQYGVLPYSIYTLDVLTKQAYDREQGDWASGGSDFGTGFGTQPPTVLFDPMDARDGTRHDPDEWYDKVVPPDGATITYPPDDVPDVPGGGVSNGGPIVKQSDYFHPYSRGIRGPRYDAVDFPNARGNGVVASYQAGSPPAGVFTGPEDALDWNFGAAGGNGPYLGESTVGTRYIFDFPTPVKLTAILAASPNSTDTHGMWRVQAFTGAGDDGSGLFDAPHVVKATLSNNNRTATSNAAGADSGARAKDTAARFAGKYVFEVDYPAGSLAGFAMGVCGEGTSFAAVSAGGAPHGAMVLRPDGFLDIGGSAGGNVGHAPGGLRCMFAWDFDRKLVFVKVGSNAWNGDPAAGTGGLSFNDFSVTGTTMSPQYPLAVFGDTGRVAKFYMDGFTNTIPAGFEPWPEFAGAWADIGEPVLFNMPGSVVNSRYGTAIEFPVQKNLAKTARKFALTCAVAGGGGRMATEFVFGIEASALMGGNRNPAEPDVDGSYVRVTSTFPMTVNKNGSLLPVDQTAPDREARFNELVNGVISSNNGGENGEAIITTETPKTNTGSGTERTASKMMFNNANDAAGNYIQFTFARGVNLRAIIPVLEMNENAFEVLDSGGNPTRWGTWKVTWATSPTGPWTDALDGPQHFTDRSYRPFIPVNTGDNLPRPYWRLEKISGSQLTAAAGRGFEQFDFILDDVGDPVTPPVVFMDEDGLSVTITTTEPSQPQDPSQLSVNFTDEDGLSATMKLKFNVRLQAAFTDDSVLDVFSALSPSLITQTPLYQTGRDH